MEISIIGTGYVGLVTGVCFAEKGHDVVCVDVDQKKVDLINAGTPPIFERGLEALLRKNIKRGLRATTDLQKAVHETQISMIAVGTPFDGQRIDLSYIKMVSRQIGEALKTKQGYHLVVVKSTVVPGTTDDVVLPLLEEASGKRAGEAFGVGMNPEFLTEGEAVSDFLSPDRIVLGGNDQASIDLQAALYAGFPGVDVLRTNNKTAEMIKYTSNALLATMISFSNEMANFCAAVKNVDILDVLKGVHLSRYLKVQLPTGETVLPPITSFLGAGCGFGGSCLPKDVKALAAHGAQVGAPMPLLEAVLQVNQQQPARVMALARKHFPALKHVNVSVLGLSFRPDTNDMRESPAIPILRELLREQAAVRAYDPIANHEAKALFPNGEITFCGSLREAVEGAEVVILVTRWDEFKILPQLLAGMASQPVLVDGRRMLEKRAVARYEGIGL